MARLLVLICLYGLAAQTNAGQFYPSFYSTPSFQPVLNPFLYNQAQFYNPAFSQSPYDLPSVLRFQPIIPQPFTLNINTQPEVNTKSNNQESQSTTETPQIQQTPPTPQIPLRGFPQTLSPAFRNDFVGYSYRTQFGDGATSTVVLFQGGHPQDIAVTRKRITVASDSLDPQRINDAEQSIEKILSGRSGKSLSSPVNHQSDFSQVITAILESPSMQPGTYYYYQSDETLQPSEGISTSTHRNEEATTTKIEDETTKHVEEDVGEETEPPLKHEAVESTVGEQRSISNEESESISTSSSSTESSGGDEASSSESSSQSSSEAEKVAETTTSSR